MTVYRIRGAWRRALYRRAALTTARGDYVVRAGRTPDGVVVCGGAGRGARSRRDEVGAPRGTRRSLRRAPVFQVYKSFPGLGRLYVHDADGVAASRCIEGCASAWPPLLVTIGKSGEKVGDWTVIVRDDGRLQWAYRGHPVYTRFHDLEEDTQSLAAEGFHLLTP